jgi:hypothetical protein
LSFLHGLLPRYLVESQMGGVRKALAQCAIPVSGRAAHIRAASI